MARFKFIKDFVLDPISLSAISKIAAGSEGTEIEDFLKDPSGKTVNLEMDEPWGKNRLYEIHWVPKEYLQLIED